MMGFSCFLHDLSFISIDQAAQLCNRIGLPVPKISLMLCPVCIARTDAMPAAVAYGTNRTDPKGTPHPTMGDGTPAMGKRHKKTHALCPRCGKRSYHTQKTAFHGSWRAGIRNKFSINLWSFMILRACVCRKQISFQAERCWKVLRLNFEKVADWQTTMPQTLLEHDRMISNIPWLCIVAGFALHQRRKQCAACGFPATKIRSYNWSKKSKRRRAPGTGRMRRCRGPVFPGQTIQACTHTHILDNYIYIYLDPQRCEILVTKVFSGEKGDNNLILGTYPKKSNKAPSTCSSPK